MPRVNPLESISLLDKLRNQELRVVRWDNKHGGKLRLRIASVAPMPNPQNIQLQRREAIRLRDAITKWLER